MQNINLTIYPTLVIGIGGTGANVVRHAKKRFLRTWGNNGTDDLPAMIQLLAIDTEPLVNKIGEEPLLFHEYAFLGKFDATKLVTNKDRHVFQNSDEPEKGSGTKSYFDWWGWNTNEFPLGYIHNGAKQQRAIGRLAFVRNYVTFKKAFLEKWNNLVNISEVNRAQERKFHVEPNQKIVYLVSSLCGGTGSGMFLDVAHCVRHYIGAKGKLIGIFLLPSAFQAEMRSDLQSRRIHANAYASLKELDHYQQVQDFRQRYPSEQTDIPSIPYKPFDNVFLIEKHDRNGLSLTNKKSVEQAVAHLIHLMALSPMNKDILAQDVNVTSERQSGSLGAYLSYSTFGVSAITFPATTGITEICELSIRRRILADLCGTDPHKKKVDNLVNGIKGIFEKFIDQYWLLSSNEKPDDKKKLNHLESGGPNWDEMISSIYNELTRIIFLDGGGFLLAEETMKESLNKFRPDSDVRWNDSATWGIQKFEPPRFTIGILEPILKNRKQRHTDSKKRLAAELYEQREKLFKIWLKKTTDTINNLSQDLHQLNISILNQLRSDSVEISEMLGKIDPFKRDDSAPHAETLYELETNVLGNCETEALFRLAEDALSNKIIIKSKSGAEESKTYQKAISESIISELAKNSWKLNATQGKRITSLRKRKRREW